jgi:hypothetical protein
MRQPATPPPCLIVRRIAVVLLMTVVAVLAWRYVCAPDGANSEQWVSSEAKPSDEHPGRPVTGYSGPRQPNDAAIAVLPAEVKSVLLYHGLIFLLRMIRLETSQTGPASGAPVQQDLQKFLDMLLRLANLLCKGEEGQSAKELHHSLMALTTLFVSVRVHHG